MSAVRAAKPILAEPVTTRVDVRAMQDMLYDILATGVDSEQASVSIDAVESFLHEHARAAKSPEEFLAFFAQQGLTIHGRAPRPAAAALPPIQRPVAQDEAQVLKFPVELAKSAEAADDLALVASFAPNALSANVGGGRAWLAWSFGAAAVIAISALAYVGYETILSLEQRLEQSHAAAQVDRKAISALEHQQVNLESNVAASAQMMERVDQKSDLILESVQDVAKKTAHRH
jgi:hypothetical protein